MRCLNIIMKKSQLKSPATSKRRQTSPSSRAVSTRVSIGKPIEQKNSFELIQKNELRYKAFVQNSSEGIWCFGLKQPMDISLSVKTQIKRFFKDAYLLECNNEYAKMYGFTSAAEIIGARLEDMLVKDDPKNIQYLTDFILSNYRLRETETTEHDKNGRRFSVLNNLIGTVVDGKLIDAWGTQRDITAQKRAEEELRKKNIEHTFLAEASMALAECSTEKEVYGVIRQKLLRLIPGCVLIIMNTSPDGQKSIVVDIVGIDSSIFSAGMKMLRFDPVGKAFDNMKGFAELFCKPNLHKFNGGLFEVSSGVIPKFIARRIEKLLGVRGFYSIGIAEENSYLGYIHIFTKEPEMPVAPSTIETFTHQCHLALTKINTLLKVAEEAHRRMKMMNTSSDGIAIIDQQHCIVECNPRFAQMLGYTISELVGFHTWDFEAVMSEHDIRKNFADLSSINTIFETRHRRKDGTTFDVEVSADGTRVGNEPLIFVVCRNITERKDMIRALRNSEEKHRMLFDTMAQGVVYQDNNGAIVSANPAAERLLGISVDQMMGRTSLDPRWHCIHEDGTLYPGETHPPMVALSTGKQVLGCMMGVFNVLTDRYAWIIIDSVPQFSPGESAPFMVYTTFENVTERKMIEEERKKNLEQIKLSEESYRGLFNSVQDAIYIQNENAEFLDVNDGAVAMYGYSREELVGKTPAFVSAPNMNDDFDFPAILGEVMKGNPYHFEFWGKRKNGEIFPKSVSLYKGTYFSKQVIIALAQDITVRVAVENVRKESEQKLRNIFEALEEGLALNELVYNEDGEVVDYRILEVNSAFKRVGNFGHNNFSGRLATDLYKMPREYISSFWKEHLHDTQSIKTDLFDEQTKRWTHVSASVPVNGKFVTSFVDITELKNTEQALRSSEQYNRSLHDTSPNATTVSDLNGNLVYINKQALIMYGHDLNEDLIGRNIFGWIPDYHREEVIARVKELITGGTLRNYQTTVKRKNGELFSAEINASLVPNSDGEPAFFLIIVSDISERVKSDKEVRRIKKRLERAESVAQFGNWELSINEKMIHASDGAKKIYGIITNIIPLELAQGIVLEEYQSMMNRALSDLVEKDIPYTVEFKIRRASDGEIRDIFSKAEYHEDSQKIFGVIHDITDRKKAQEHLEKSEQRYRNIVDNLHQAYYESNRKAVLTYCNPGFLIMSGYNEVELKSCVSFKMVAPEHRPRVIGAYIGMMAEKRSDMTIEFLIATKEGKKIWVEQTTHFDFNGAGHFSKASHFVKDISERKQSQERLMESEQRYRQITEAVTDYIYTVTMENHVVSSTKHGPGCRAVTGYTQEDFDQNRFLWYNMVVPEDRTIVEEQLDALLEQKNSAPIEHRIFRKDGNLRWVRKTLVPRRNESGEIISYDGLIQDVTERKEAELKLRSSEERNRALVSSLPDIMFVHDKNGLFLDYHTPGNTPLWFEPEYFLGKSFTDILPKEVVDIVIPKFKAAFITNDLQTYEYSALNGNETKFYEARIIAFENNKALNIIRDVTDKVRAENDLRTLNEDLESRVIERTAQLTEANQELEAFSYSVSHDLRAPLRAIDSFSAILLEGNEDKFDDEGKRLISVIRTSIRKMDLLINGLLTLSRIGRSELHITAINMNSLAHTLINENLSEDQRNRYTIRIDDLPAVNGDESLIRQALNNLLSNAVKYSAAVEHPAIEISGTILENSAVYSVKDNGAGFDPSKATKLFGIFQRLHTDDQFKGLGVGLSIVQRIIHRHGGRVWADGKLNGGAIFSFSLPCGKE